MNNIDNNITEPYFESIIHKYNVVRKIFWEHRCKRSSQVLIYQPKRLKEICEKYEFEFILNIIKDTMSEKRGNYFNTFIVLIGEEISQGGWSYYIKDKE